MSGSGGERARSALTELLRRPKVPLEWGSKHVVWVHDGSVSPDELVLNPALFPDALAGDGVALVNPANGRRMFLTVSTIEKNPFKQTSFELSLHRDVAEQLGLEAARSDIYVKVLARDQITRAEYVVISFRDQYIGRLPMRQIRESLTDSIVYVGKNVDLPNACVRAKIHSLFDAEKRPLISGVCKGSFVANFRSETAKISILVQIAQESLEWDPITGQTFLEKAVDGFLRELFTRWKSENVNHIVSIILFCRVDYHNGNDQAAANNVGRGQLSLMAPHLEEKDISTTFDTFSGGKKVTKDYYSVVVQWESQSDWRVVIPRIRQEASSLMESFKGEGGARLTPAKRGNFLEAVHLALMIFDKHFVDRDLSKTGMSIITLTPGTGHFLVDGTEGYTLCKLAKRKVIDDGIWLQLVCLERPPLYATPLLEILNWENEPFQKYYPPYWIQCGYYKGTCQWNPDEASHFFNTRTLDSAAISIKSFSSANKTSNEARPEVDPQKHPSSSNRSDPQPDSPLVSTHLPLALSETTSLPSLLSSEGYGSPLDANFNEEGYNPCDPMSTRVRHCSMCSLKWSKLVTLCEKSKDDPLDRQPPDWSTLVAPPCLPIGTELVMPPHDLLHRDFTLAEAYKVVPKPGTFFLAPEAGLAELKHEFVALRVALGMQEILENADLDQLPIKDRSILFIKHELHLVSIENDGVKVERYLRKPRGSRQVLGSVLYTANIKPRLHDDFVEKEFDLCPSTIKDYPWVEVDKMLAGHETRETVGGRYWQTRFILIPAEAAPRNTLIMATAANETLDDEELRIAGFLKFVEVFQRSALTQPTPTRYGENIFRMPREQQTTCSKQISSIEALKILLTTSTCSAYAAQEVSRIESDHENSAIIMTIPRMQETKETFSLTTFQPMPAKDISQIPEFPPGVEEDLDKVVHVEPLRTDSSLEHAAVLMQHPLVGIPIKNRRWHWRMYQSAFIGSVAVDWMLKFFEDIPSREAAVTHGNWLMSQGMWEHITGTHGFLDGYYYYRFSPSYNIGTLRRSNPNILSTISNREDTDIIEESLIPHPIVMSRSIVIDVDLQRRSAQRREWAFLHYDSTHNPKNTFHFRLHWLTCSARLIDDLIQAWARRALQCGFVMLEAPIEAPGPPQTTAPFHTALRIDFAIRPPCVDELNSRLGIKIAPTFFAEELLRNNGFVLDHESDEKLPKGNDKAKNSLESQEAFTFKGSLAGHDEVMEEEDRDHGNFNTKWKLLWSYERDENYQTQYVHRMGVAIVQVDKDGGGLLWMPNRLLLASTSNRAIRPSQHSAFFELEGQIRRTLVTLCNDKEALDCTWQDTLAKLGQRIGISTILDDLPDDLAEGAPGVIGSPENIFDRITITD